MVGQVMNEVRGRIVFVVRVAKDLNSYGDIQVFKDFPTKEQLCKLLVGISPDNLWDTYLRPAFLALERVGFKNDHYISWRMQEPGQKDQFVSIHCREVQ